MQADSWKDLIPELNMVLGAVIAIVAQWLSGRREREARQHEADIREKRKAEERERSAVDNLRRDLRALQEAIRRLTDATRRSFLAVKEPKNFKQLEVMTKSHQAVMRAQDHTMIRVFRIPDRKLDEMVCVLVRMSTEMRDPDQAKAVAGLYAMNRMAVDVHRRISLLIHEPWRIKEDPPTRPIWSKVAPPLGDGEAAPIDSRGA